MKNGGIAEIPNPNLRLEEQLRIMAEEQKKKDDEQKRKDDEQKRKEEEREKEREREKEEQRKEKEKYEKDMAELRNMMKEMLTQKQQAVGAPINNTLNGNVTVNNNITVVINNYNEPKVDHLLEFNTFRKIFGSADNDLPLQMIFQTYFDPSHPENASIHLLDGETKRVLAMANGGWRTFAMDNIILQMREIGYKYAFEGCKLHLDSEVKEHRDYMQSKGETINKIKRQEYSIRSREYESKEITGKLQDEFIASSKHPAVIAEHARLRREIAAAKSAQ
jgi:hypothetical protein